jgi:hypothetical protein
MPDSHTLIESQVLTSDVTSIDFTSIPSGYSHLRLYCSGPGDNNTWLGMRFNDNSTSGHYRENYMSAEGSGTMYGKIGGLSYIALGSQFYRTDAVSTCELTIPYYRHSSYKYVMFRSGSAYNWYGGCGEWVNTSAITKITLFADSGGMREHGQYSLFGLD